MFLNNQSLYKLSYIKAEKLKIYEAEKMNEIYQDYTQYYDTNISVRVDWAVWCACRDYAIEKLLHSKLYKFRRIGILLNPYKNAPQTAILIMYTKIKVAVDIEMVSAGGHTYQDTTDFRHYHKLSVTGLEVGDNTVSLSLRDENGKIINKRTITIKLKDTKLKKQPQALKTESNAQSAYESLLITGSAHGHPYVFRPDGSIMHYNKIDKYKVTGYGIFPLPNNRFLWPTGDVRVQTHANSHSTLVYEMDYMGRVFKTFHVEKGMHHYACELPNGNILACSNTNIKHTEDMLIELDRKTGAVVSTLDMKDIFGDHYKDAVDWAHCNCLEYKPDEDSLLINLRNLHSTVKIRWSTKEILWILALPEFWENTEVSQYVLKPEGDVKYSYQAHAAHEVMDYEGLEPDEKAYIIFDNHKFNRRPLNGWTSDGYSYINMYVVNEKKKTVRQLLNKQIPFSSIRSNAVCDQKNNRLLNFSGCLGKKYVDLYGAIEEYNLQTGELLNKWTYNTDFFSGQVFTWRSDDYYQSIEVDEKAMLVCGTVDSMKEVDALQIPEKVLEDEIYYSKPLIEGHVMYFKTKDHSIESLLFIGDEHTYERDYTNTVQTVAVHGEAKYFFSIGLMNLVPDTYRICVKVDGEIYNTGSEITIKKMADEK